MTSFRARPYTPTKNPSMSKGFIGLLNGTSRSLVAAARAACSAAALAAACAAFTRSAAASGSAFTAAAASRAPRASGADHAAAGLDRPLELAPLLLAEDLLHGVGQR